MCATDKVIAEAEAEITNYKQPVGTPALQYS